MSLDPLSASTGGLRTGVRPRTIKVRSAEHDGQEVTINEADFDAEKHERVDEQPLARAGSRARLATGRPNLAPPSEAQTEDKNVEGAKTGTAGATAAAKK